VRNNLPVHSRKILRCPSGQVNERPSPLAW
jgi:hypothetical protein